MMESQHSLLWKYFAVCETDATKPERTICKTLRVLHANDLLSFFLFNNYWYSYSAEYRSEIFGIRPNTENTYSVQSYTLTTLSAK